MSSAFRWILVAAVATVVGASSTIPMTAQRTIREALRDRIDMLSTTPGATLGGAPIAAINLIDNLYSRRNYKPAWTDPHMVRELFDQVMMSAEHGLDPNDFHARGIESRLATSPLRSDPVSIADLEILCTDALVRLTVTLEYGKLDPADLDPTWNFSREIDHRDPVSLMNEVLESKQIALRLAQAGPQTQQYRWFRSALAEYRSIQRTGGWSSVSAGAVLELGSRGPRVLELRARLRVSGDLTNGQGAGSDEFDRDLETAVKRFQDRHGIDADGKVGPKTIAELNVPVETRINQLRASLERMRWVFRDLPSDYLIVDIAGFRAHLFRGGVEVWSTRVQVGQPYHATPVFKDSLSYLELNPTWTVPPDILRNETLPAIRKDPEYLIRNGMSVVTTSGVVVDPSTVDWSKTSSRTFPYMIRQEPGDLNALGRVKFMFPNRYMVYLHDTPSKGLFASSDRASSHGCIRIEDPLELAELLLTPQGWDRARLEHVLASRTTTRVNLVPPLTVMLLYWTAEADADGTVYFRRDVYGRDPAVFEGLDEPFRFSPPRRAGMPNDGR